MALITIYVTTRLKVDLREGVDVGDLLSEMDYTFTPAPEHGTLVDSEILTGGEEVEHE